MKSITVQELSERAGVPLIDVREPDEYAAGHVPGAVNLPMSTIGDHLDELPAVRFGRSYRVPESAVSDLVQRPIADVG